VIRLRTLWESIRATYWAAPSLMALAAVSLSAGMVRLDETVTARWVDAASWVYTGGPEGARAVLSTIPASMITVAGMTFSITIVALTLASQQFGPRLLRDFLRDLGNQIVLGTFIATFIYCRLVLRTVRGHDDAEFVPYLAVTAGVVLAMLSLGPHLLDPSRGHLDSSVRDGPNFQHGRPERNPVISRSSVLHQRLDHVDRTSGSKCTGHGRKRRLQRASVSTSHRAIESPVCDEIGC
jgi:hypothetical protein